MELQLCSNIPTQLEVDTPGIIEILNNKPRHTITIEQTIDHYVRSKGIKFEVGRNDPCLCGSNRKYKKCCGRN